jgi:hypothetical protein
MILRLLCIWLVFYSLLTMHLFCVLFNKVGMFCKCLSCSFYLYRFRKYVSYSFPIINFCNQGVHYETPCIFTNTYSADGFSSLTFWHRSFTFNSNKSQIWSNNFFSLLSWSLFTAQHVLGVFPPIIRSSMTAVAASGFTFVSWWQSCCGHGRAGRPDHEHSTIKNWKMVASGWWFIWIVRWCMDLTNLKVYI